MYRIYECVATKHDLRVLVLALLLCFLASSTAIIMAQRALGAPESKRWPWLLAAGAVTGLGIWATHFAAMLAFEPGASIRFDMQYTLSALACAVAFSVAGWTVAFWRDQSRLLLGGTLIGTGLIGAHFLDTFGMQFAGTVTLDADLVTYRLCLACPFAFSLLSSSRGTKVQAFQSSQA